MNSLSQPFLSIREFEYETCLSHGLKPEVNISHARKVVSPRLNLLAKQLITCCGPFRYADVRENQRIAGFPH